MATDFMPVTEGFPSIPALVHACPSCGFSGEEDDFSGKQELPEAVKQRVFLELKPHLKGRRVSAPRAYQNAAMILEWRGAPAVTVADGYLKAAWCCRLQCTNDTGRDEEYFLREALERFEHAVASKITSDDVTARTTYLIGEA